MFTIPDFKQESPSLEENVEALFESISKEEEALKKLVCLEAEKIKRFIGGGFGFTIERSPNEILSFVQSMKRISELIVQKGLFLVQRLQNIFLIENRMMCTLTKQIEISTDLKRLHVSISEYLLSVESLMEAVEEHQRFSSDPALSMCCKLLNQIQRQMGLLTDTELGTNKKKVRVLYPAPPPLPRPWKPKKNPS